VSADGAAPGAEPLAGLRCYGLHHRSVPPEVRERLFIEPPAPEAVLAALDGLADVGALALATCERLELLLVAPAWDAETEASAIRALIGCADVVVPDTDLEAALTVLKGPAALRHLFAVAAALESRIPGEPEILGQVKAAHRAAVAAGRLDPLLERALPAAYVVAKRVRQETALAAHPVSIAAAALKVAREVHGDPRRLSVLLLGLGEVSELMAAQVREAGVARLTVCHPAARRAEAAAARWQAAVQPWDAREAALAEADVVVAALGRGGYILDGALMRRVFKRRRQRPMFVVDAAVPPDVAPAVAALDPAFVYDLGDLERIAAEGLAQRETAALDAWRIVDQELDAFRRRADAAGAGPAIGALRSHAEALRTAVLAEGKHDPEATTRRLLNRLLHAPSEALREAAARDPAEHAELARALRRLFALDRADDDEPARKPSDDET